MVVEAPTARQRETEVAEQTWPPPQGEWTYEDWLRLPDDGWQYEVIKGVLYVTPAPKPRHQRVSRDLEFRMWDFARTQQLGEVYDAPVDVYLPGQETPVQPDLIFIIQDRLHIVDLDDAIRGAPDLIVEVLSPSNWIVDRKDKLALYAETGVREYWIVDPKSYGEPFDPAEARPGRIDVYALREAGYELLGRWGAGETVHSEVLRGFSVAVDELLGLG